MNKIIISGNIGRSELKHTEKNVAVLNFSVAVTNSYDREKTDWFNCVLFGKRAESLAKYIKKGAAVVVCGRIESNKYQEKTYWKVIVDEVDITKWAEFQSLV